MRCSDALKTRPTAWMKSYSKHFQSNDCWQTTDSSQTIAQCISEHQDKESAPYQATGSQLWHSIQTRGLTIRKDLNIYNTSWSPAVKGHGGGNISVRIIQFITSRAIISICMLLRKRHCADKNELNVGVNQLQYPINSSSTMNETSPH